MSWARRRCLVAIAAPLLGSWLSGSAGAVERTLPKSAFSIRILRERSHPLTTIAEAARFAQSGDVVEIAAGEYVDDFATWPQDDLTIRAVGGRARLMASAASTQEKAIWVIKGNNVIVENIEFSGARAPSRNGAGIRHEGGKLTVRRCLFERNEMGLLTWNNGNAELVVEGSEFRDNAVAQSYQPGDRIGHQLYVGSIRKFTLRNSYVHRGAFGHLVKSRARESHVAYNRLTDESGGRASYELEFPDGGVAYVVGNIIQQSARTENEVIVSFGAERYKWPANELYLVHNTLVDDLPSGGQFLHVGPGADRVKVLNNVLLGAAALIPGASSGNFKVRGNDVASAAEHNYRLKARAGLARLAIDPGEANGVKLRPEREYAHPLQSRPLAGGRYSPGAVQSAAP